MSHFLLRRLGSLVASNNAIRGQTIQSLRIYKQLIRYRIVLPPPPLSLTYYPTLSRNYTVASSIQEDIETAEYENDDPSLYEPNDSSAMALSQHLSPTNLLQLQEIVKNNDLTLKRMRDIPVKVHNVHLANLKAQGQLEAIFRYYRRMKMVQLPSADYMSIISPELAQRAMQHPIFPLCNQLTYSIVMQAIAELYDYSKPVVEPLTEVYWDLNRAGWPPSRYMTRTMLIALAKREIQVQRQLEEIERPNLIRAVKYTNNNGISNDDIAYKSIQPERDRLMAECNLEQAMTIFLATPPEVRMSLHRTLLNLLLKAAAERGDPQAALSVFEWMSIDGRELPKSTMETSTSSTALSSAKMKLLEEINEFHDNLPFSKPARSVQLATRPSAVTHPSAVVKDLFESAFNSMKQHHDIAVKRQHYRLQTPTHASYAELAGAFARVGDIASALMCIRLSEETRHLFRVRQPDLIYRRIAEMLARRGDLGGAIWIVTSRMRTDGIVPSSDCLRSVTRAICNWDRVDYAAQFIKRVRREANTGVVGILDNTVDRQTIGRFASSYNEILEAACRHAQDDPLYAQLAYRIFNQRRQRTSLFYPTTLNAYLQLAADLGDTTTVCEVLAELRASTSTSSSCHLYQAGVTAIINLLKRCGKPSDKVKIPTAEEILELTKRLHPGEHWMEPRKQQPPATTLRAIVQRSLYVLLPSTVIGNSRQRQSWRQLTQHNVHLPQSHYNRDTAMVANKDPMSVEHLMWLREISMAAIQGASLAYGAPHYGYDTNTMSVPVEQLLLHTLDRWHTASLQAVVARAIMREYRLYHANQVTMGGELALLVLQTQINDCELYMEAQTKWQDFINNEKIDPTMVELISNNPAVQQLRSTKSSADYLNVLDLKDLFSTIYGIFYIDLADPDYIRRINYKCDTPSTESQSNLGNLPSLTERVELLARLLSHLTPRLQQAYSGSTQFTDIRTALETIQVITRRSITNINADNDSTPSIVTSNLNHDGYIHQSIDDESISDTTTPMAQVYQDAQNALVKLNSFNN